MSDLSQKSCVPCRGGIPPLKGEALQALHTQLGGHWKLVATHHLEKEFKFRNFQEALNFTNQVGALAEQENHHPDIGLRWGSVTITLYTHKVDGLVENDFILAAKIETLTK